MAHYLRQNPDEEASQARGDQKTFYLHSFLALQMRVKSGEAILNNSHTVDKLSEQSTKTHEWSKEQMDLRLGAPCFIDG